ncbi:MAG: type IV secretory system conjugative DNA transfer family protein [Pseudomonadota bacterium]
MTFNDANTKYGSAGFEHIANIEKASLLSGKGLHVGYTRERRARQICVPSTNSTLTIGNSGSGKGSTKIIPQFLDTETNIVCVDVKPEHALIASLNILIEKYCLNGYEIGCDAPWFLPRDRMNPFDATSPAQPGFFEEALLFAMSIAEKPKGDSGGNSKHFYEKVVSLFQAIIMDGKYHNPHFSPIDLTNVVNDIATGGGEYFDFHIARMKASPFATVGAQACELKSKAQMVPAEYGSIMSSASTALRPFGSPAIASMCSSPSTITPKDFVTGDSAKHLFIMFPEYAVEQSAAPIRCITTAIFIEQQRHVARPLRFLLDEANILGNFHLIPKIAYLGRGYKTTADIYYQNFGQIFDNFGKHESDTILANCPYKLILGVSSQMTAKIVSEMCGKQTYEYLPKGKRSEAAFKRSLTMQKMLVGNDMLGGMLEVARQSRALDTPESVARQVLNPDEVIRRAADMGLLFTSGFGLKPIQTLQKHYFLDRALVTRFLPNPQHPPFDKVIVPNRFGRMTPRNVISERVPDAISHLNQYAEGYWSYIEGFHPLQPKRWWQLRSNT